MGCANHRKGKFAEKGAVLGIKHTKAHALDCAAGEVHVSRSCLIKKPTRPFQACKPQTSACTSTWAWPWMGDVQRQGGMHIDRATHMRQNKLFCCHNGADLLLLQCSGACCWLWECTWTWVCIWTSPYTWAGHVHSLSGSLVAHKNLAAVWGSIQHSAALWQRKALW